MSEAKSAKGIPLGKSPLSFQKEISHSPRRIRNDNPELFGQPLCEESIVNNAKKDSNIQHSKIENYPSDFIIPPSTCGNPTSPLPDLSSFLSLINSIKILSSNPLINFPLLSVL